MTIDIENFSFEDIIAPVTPEEFFADYYDKKPLYIPGNQKKFDGVMNWDVLNRILNMNAIWSEKNLVMVLDRQVIAPGSYCTLQVNRSGVEEMRPDAEKVMAIFKEGASLGINDIDTLTPEIACVVTAFEKALNAKGQCNLYCSWAQRQAFQSHFDTHDVYAIHFEGEKTWRVWTNRMPHPIRHPRFIAPNEEFDLQNRGDVMMEITMTPGDLLYLPRGWYHDALSSSDGCNHIAFGMTHLIGMDLLTSIADMAVNKEIFRHNFPRRAEGRKALKKYAKALANELASLVETDEFLESFESLQDNYHYNRGGFNLPVKAKEITYQVSNPNFQVRQQQGQWGLFTPKGGTPIPPGYEEPLKWVIKEKSFKRNDFTRKFSAMGIDVLDKFLTDILKMNVITNVTK